MPHSWSNKTLIRINHDYLSRFIMASILKEQDFNPDQSWLLIQIDHDFNLDQIRLQSGTIKTSILIIPNFKPEFNHDYLSRFIKTSIQINPVLNPDQTRLQSESIVIPIQINQDFNPDQSRLHTWFNHGLNPERTRLQSRSIITTYPDLSWIQSRSISRFPSGSIMTIFPDLSKLQSG